MLNCEFSDPVYLDPSTDQLTPLDDKVLKTTSWNYSKMTCEGSGISTTALPYDVEQIISQDTEKEFFLQKTISYGDFLIVSFFILIIIGFLVFFIRDFAKNRKLERL